MRRRKLDRGGREESVKFIGRRMVTERETEVCGSLEGKFRRKLELKVRVMRGEKEKGK